MNISIRPNLNKKGMLTVHSNILGKKIQTTHQITIWCESTTVRPSGQYNAEHRKRKEVHASLNGQEFSFIPIKDDDPVIKYRPHLGEKYFTIDGEKFEGGCYVTMIGWKAYKVKPVT